ncbi:MAG: amidase [Acidobacteria bacterium]|nr:amidase [Acidobacteriota bacterium]
MPVRPPNQDELKTMAAELGFHLSQDDLTFFCNFLPPYIDAYNVLEQLPEPLPRLKYPDRSFWRPSAAENQYNAWYVRTSIRAEQQGKLSGKKIAIKDNVCVAGVPLMNGASFLEGFIPQVDATVVTRILDAGGEIEGKAVCEFLCTSGGSHTSATGPVQNPRKAGYSAGGSSSGSAALVAAGEVDMAIGADQAGSIRIPASYCGVYGLKPTYGLVPYTGIIPIEFTLDHAGPISRSLQDNALLLEVIAGSDGWDPRQNRVPAVRYVNEIDKGMRGLRIALVREGFSHPHSQKDVDDSVRQAWHKLEACGAQIGELSIPMHRMGPVIWGAIAFEGATDLMLKKNTNPINHRGLFLPDLLAAHSAWRKHADQLPDTVKVIALAGHYMERSFGGLYYAKAQNLSHQLRDAYNRAFEDFDVLVMPTTPMKASLLPDAHTSRADVLVRAFENLTNTCPFNVTGHPALSVPCGTREGLPVGLMLIGRHFAEGTLYRTACALEECLK